MKDYPKVVKVINPFQVVLNKGTKHGIKEGQWFRIVEQTNEELRDPDTNELLGYLEIPKGVGEIISAKENYSVLESRNFEKIPTPPNLLAKILNIPTYTYKKKGFNSPKIGDIAVPLNP